MAAHHRVRKYRALPAGQGVLRATESAARSDLERHVGGRAAELPRDDDGRGQQEARLSVLPLGGGRLMTRDNEERRTIYD